MWRAFNMAVKMLLFALLWSVGEIVPSAANPIKDPCPHPFRETAASSPYGAVLLCCKPIEHFSCQPGHEVVACKKDYGSAECRPCAPGLIQNQYSDSKNIRPCRRPNPCTEEAELVEVEGKQQCQCNASQGYCGHEQDCLKVDKTCPDGFKLHHRHCNCTAATTETPTALSTSATTTTPGLTSELLKATGSPRNGTSVKENGTTTGRSMAAAPPHSVEEKEVLTSNSKSLGNADTHSAAIIAASIFAVIVLFLTVIGIIRIKGNNNNNNSNNTSVTNFCCNVWPQAPGSEGLGQQNEENNGPLMRELDSESSTSEGNPETDVPVEEKRMAVPEEDSSEAGADQTDPKDGYIRINNRASTDMFNG